MSRSTRTELKWADYAESVGSTGAYWHWFPVFGGGDADFDYKLVSAYPTFAAIGADFEHLANGGGRKVAQETFGDLGDCDDARVYVSNNRRIAQLRE